MDWISNFSKIKNFYNCLQDLLLDLSTDVNNYLKHEQNNGLFTYIEEKRQEQTTDFNHKSWWQYIIDFLVSIEYPNDYKKILINDLKVYYDGNNHELNILQEFERTYTPKDAICWYTRPTFFYRLINKALRQRDVSVVFRFGFFFKDLYEQLKQLHNYDKESLPSIIRCYRGQIMSADEREQIINSSILLIQTNCLLSASINRDISLLYLQPDNRKIDSILFEIEIHTQYISYPYGNIKHLSYIPDEEEILFSVGTVFEAKPENTFYDEKQNIWFIKLTLYNDENLFKNNFQEENIIKEEINRLKYQLNKLVKLTYQWTNENLNDIFQQIMILYPEEQWISAIMYKALGKRNLHTPIYSRSSEFNNTNESEFYDRAIKNYENRIQIWQKYISYDQLDCFYEIAQLYRCIIQVCRITLNQELENKNINLAMEYNRIAIRQAKKRKNYRQLAAIYRNCARVYFENSCPLLWLYRSHSVKSEKLAITYSKKEGNVLVKYLPDMSTMLADCYVRIAEMYDAITRIHSKHSDPEAFKYYNKALQIYLVQPPSKINALCISNISNTIVHRCHRKNYKNRKLALKYQLISTENTIIANTPIKMYHVETTNIVQSYKELAHCYECVNKYDLAIETLLLAIKTYENNEEEFSEQINQQRIKEIKQDIKLLQLKAQTGWKYDSKKTPPELPSPDVIDDKSISDTAYEY